MDKPCEDRDINGDYETWFAHEDANIHDEQEKGCQLGQKVYYKKLKKEAICFQG